MFGSGCSPQQLVFRSRMLPELQARAEGVPRLLQGAHALRDARHAALRTPADVLAPLPVHHSGVAVNTITV